MDDVYTDCSEPCHKKAKLNVQSPADLLLVGSDPERPLSVNNIKNCASKAWLQTWAAGTSSGSWTAISANAHGNIFLTNIDVIIQASLVNQISTQFLSIMGRLFKLGSHEAAPTPNPVLGNTIWNANNPNLVDWDIQSLIDSPSASQAAILRLRSPPNAVYKFLANDSLLVYLSLPVLNGSQQLHFYGAITYDFYSM